VEAGSLTHIEVSDLHIPARVCIFPRDEAGERALGHTAFLRDETDDNGHQPEIAKPSKSVIGICRKNDFVIALLWRAHTGGSEGERRAIKAAGTVSLWLSYLPIGIEQVSETIFMLVTFICIMPLLIPVSELPELIAPPDAMAPPEPASMCCIEPMTVTVCPT
jgi:hypothetical protein